MFQHGAQHSVYSCHFVFIDIRFVRQELFYEYLHSVFDCSTSNGIYSATTCALNMKKTTFGCYKFSLPKPNAIVHLSVDGGRSIS